MGTLYLLLCGVGFGGVLFFLRRTATKWYHWILAILLYIWICLGISFVYINNAGYHHQAARVGALFFGLTAIAWAFAFARSMGFIGKKKTIQEPS